MRWLEVDVHTDTDPKIDRLLNTFGNQGFGVLVRLWLLVARKGAKPGMAIDSNGEPFSASYMAKQADSSPAFVRRVLELAAEVGHIDRAIWRDQGAAFFPGLAKRAKKFHERKTSTERTQAHRAKRFDRIAERDGRHCRRCLATEQLELERKTPREEGGGTEDANLAIVCIPCGRKRRSEREGRGLVGAGSAPVRHPYGIGSNEISQQKTQNETQDGPERDVLSCTVPTDLISTDGTHTEKAALARGFSPGSSSATPAPLRLPLVGIAPTPKPAPPEHAGHAWCGRRCVPGFLHAEFVEGIGGGGSYTEREARVVEFYRLAMQRIPADQAIADPPLKFWRREFATFFGVAETLTAATERFTGQRPQDPRKPSTVSTGADDAKRRIRESVARARSG